MPRASESATAPSLSTRRALFAACLGNAVEWYDFAIYGALGTILVDVFFPTDQGVLLGAFALYAVAFLVRPLGAVYFGRLGDARGRQAVLVTVIALMTGATAVVGVLPGYATIGLVAPLVLVGLRIAQGTAAGGELGVAAVFVVEHAPARRRGGFAAWHTATLALGLASGLLVAALLARLPGDLEDGGWRVAFLLALPLGLVGYYLRQQVSDTPRFVDLQRAETLSESPVRTLWSEHRAALVTGFAVIAAGSLSFNTFFVFMPHHLAVTTALTLPQTLLASVVGLLAAAPAAVVLGRLSDRVGRRPVVLGSITGLLACALPISMAAHSGSLLALTLAEIVAGVAIGGALSVSMLAEMFPTALRATGLGLTIGLAAALVGGTAPFLDEVLFVVTGQEAAPSWYVVAVAALALATAWTWRETAFSDLD